MTEKRPFGGKDHAVLGLKGHKGFKCEVAHAGCHFVL